LTDTIVAAGTVLTGNETIPDGAVLVRDHQLAAVGPLAEVQRIADPGTEPLRYPPTATLLPGLIDAHVRFVFNGGQTPYQDFAATDLSTEALRAQYRDTAMADRARTVLGQGVTTVRDMGDSHDLSISLAERIDAGELPGPRVIPAGVPLTTPKGDAWFLGGAVDSESSIRDAIADRAKAGARLICYHDSGGFLKLEPRTPPFSWDTQFSPEQVALIVSEAHCHGLPVAAHVFSKDGIAHAVAAEVDTIEHCYWTVGQERYDRDRAVALAMAHQGIIACLPTNTNRAHQIGAVGEQRAKELWYDRFQWLDQLGVRLATGSSAGSKTARFDDFVGCLQTYQWLDFTPEKIIQMATANAAAALGIADTTGALHVGYCADLLVVDGNPLADLQALRRPLLVMAAGRIAPTDSAAA
jgi:imidazolonepropionase-like amidohydrolase